MGHDYGYHHEKRVRNFFIGLASNTLSILLVYGLFMLPLIWGMKA